MKKLGWQEFIIPRLIRASGYSAIVFVLVILFFLLREGLPTLLETRIGDLLTTRWYPVEEYYGIKPGETTTDGNISLVSARCLGSCGLAPAAVMDGEVVGKLTPKVMLERMRRWTNQ